MRRNDILGEDWKEVEKKLRRQWLNANDNPSLTWEDVKESVRLGWKVSKRGEHESIH